MKTGGTAGMVMMTIGLLYLVVSAYTDIRKQEIFWPVGVSIMAGGLIMHMIIQDMTAAEWALGVGTGAVLALVSIATRESIGLGDCLVIAVLGSLIGMWNALVIFVAALLLSAVYAVILYVFHAQKAKARFPFVPFLLFSYGLLFLRGGLP